MSNITMTISLCQGKVLIRMRRRRDSVDTACSKRWLSIVGDGQRHGRRGALGAETIGLSAIAVARSNVVFLGVGTNEFYVDGAPAAVGIGLGVVAEGIEMAQVVADGGEGFAFVAPAVGEIGFTAGGGGHAFEHDGGDRLEFRFAGADHVDGDASGLRQFGYVFGRDHAGVVWAV